MNIWKLCSPGVMKWVKMMIKEGELKIDDDKGKGENKVYGWTGDDEIVSSIISYIILHKSDKICPRCGDELKQVVDPIAKKKTGHLWACQCSPDKIISIG